MIDFLSAHVVSGKCCQNYSPVLCGSESVGLQGTVILWRRNHTSLPYLWGVSIALKKVWSCALGYESQNEVKDAESRPRMGPKISPEMSYWLRLWALPPCSALKLIGSRLRLADQILQG